MAEALTCAGCGNPLHQWRGLNSCDTDGCGGNLAAKFAPDSTPTEREARVMFPKSVGNATVALEDITEREAGDVGEVAAVLAAHYDPTTCVRDHGMRGDVPMVQAHTEHVAAALAPLIAERERAAGARALREADVVLIDDDTAIGLAMQENALLAGLRGPWEVVTPRKHWRLYRRMVSETREVDL